MHRAGFHARNDRLCADIRNAIVNDADSIRMNAHAFDIQNDWLLSVARLGRWRVGTARPTRAGTDVIVSAGSTQMPASAQTLAQPLAWLRRKADGLQTAVRAA